MNTPAHTPAHQPDQPLRPRDYLTRLQDETRDHTGRVTGFHRDLRAWVDDASSVARVLLALDQIHQPEPQPDSQPA